jgi:hypothetical protein
MTFSGTSEATRHLRENQTIVDHAVIFANEFVKYKSIASDPTSFTSVWHPANAKWDPVAIHFPRETLPPLPSYSCLYPLASRRFLAQ